MEQIKECVVFKLENEYYGMDINLVENIEKTQSITRVPFSKSYIEGVINLRGNIIPVIDLRKRFDLNIERDSDEARIIIINYKTYRIGLRVDASSEVVQFKKSSIEKAPRVGSSIKDDFVKEVGKDNERIIMLLDVEKVLDIEDLEDM